MLFPAVVFSFSVGTMGKVYRVCRKYSLRYFHTRHPKISSDKQEGEPVGVKRKQKTGRGVVEGIAGDEEIEVSGMKRRRVGGGWESLHCKFRGLAARTWYLHWKYAYEGRYWILAVNPRILYLRTSRAVAVDSLLLRGAP